MDSYIKFSVIVPLYNKANYIKKTITSILNQTYFNFEIIIIDDGSTDNSLEVVREIKDSRIHIFSKTNGGVSAARNYGIIKAKFPYIAFIDADDWWHPYFLERIKELIETYPDAKMFGTSFAEVSNKKERPTINYHFLPKGKQILNYIQTFSKYYISPICSSAVVVKKSIFQTNLFNENITTGEDILLWIKIAINNKVAYNNEVQSFYNRTVYNSISRKLIPLQKNFMLYIKSEINTTDSEEVQILIDGLIIRMLRPYYLFNHDTPKVNKLLQSIDFSKHKFIHYLFYKLPKPIIKILYLLIKK